MKKRDLATLAMLGISAGLIVGGCQEKGKNTLTLSTLEEMTPDMKAFSDSLSPENQKKYLELDAQHRMMAQEMTQQQCEHKNSCSGIGGCQTVDHSCAGQNACKGQGGAPIKDPNRAVEIQYRNQTKQRQKLNGQMNGKNGQTKSDQN